MHFNPKGVAHTRSFGDVNARAKVDTGSTGFYMGREFRAYKELIAAASWATPIYFRFTSPIDFMLLAQRIQLDSGACRVTAWQAPTYSGTWTQVPVIGRNRMSGRPTPLYVPVCTIETGGTFTGGTEVDLIRLRTTASTGNNTAANVGVSDDDVRGLPASNFGIKIEPITGVANTDALNGKYEIIWEERPQGNTG